MKTGEPRASCELWKHSSMVRYSEHIQYIQQRAPPNSPNQGVSWGGIFHDIQSCSCWYFTTPFTWICLKCLGKSSKHVLPNGGKSHHLSSHGMIPIRKKSPTKQLPAYNSLGIQSPSENGNGTQIPCVSEVIVHPNHPLTIWLDSWGIGMFLWPSSIHGWFQVSSHVQQLLMIHHSKTRPNSPYNKSIYLGSWILF